METQSLINILIGACGALIGWVLKSIRESIVDLQTGNKELAKADSELADKVNTIELLVVGNYVKHDDLEKISNALFTKLDRIELKLDNKMDKVK